MKVVLLCSIIVADLMNGHVCESLLQPNSGVRVVVGTI
jgi:hypothetical protein